MRRNHAQRALRQVDLGHQRAARFGAGQAHARDAGGQVLAQQQRIAVPAMPGRHVRYRHELEARIAPHRREVEQPGAPAEALVDLLQGQDIGAEFRDHRGRTVRVEAAIRPHAFVQVPGCHPQVGRVRRVRVGRRTTGLA